MWLKSRFLKNAIIISTKKGGGGSGESRAECSKALVLDGGKHHPK